LGVGPRTTPPTNPEDAIDNRQVETFWFVNGARTPIATHNCGTNIDWTDDPPREVFVGIYVGNNNANLTTAVITGLRIDFLDGEGLQHIDLSSPITEVVPVAPPVSGISITGAPTRELVVGTTDTLVANVAPAAASATGTTWLSSEPGIVSVEAPTVDGRASTVQINVLAAGTATITAAHGTFSASVVVTVIPTGAGISISFRDVTDNLAPDSVTINAGDPIAFSISGSAPVTITVTDPGGYITWFRGDGARITTGPSGPFNSVLTLNYTMFAPGIGTQFITVGVWIDDRLYGTRVAVDVGL